MVVDRNSPWVELTGAGELLSSKTASKYRMFLRDHEHFFARSLSWAPPSSGIP